MREGGRGGVQRKMEKDLRTVRMCTLVAMREAPLTGCSDEAAMLLRSAKLAADIVRAYL